MFKLRPHHGLCIYFFEGKGYSNEFVANMTSKIEKLNQGIDITLTTSIDEICNKCPNNSGLCNSDEKVKCYDKSVLELCSLKEGQAINSLDFFRIVKEKIIDKNKLQYVCKDCQWFYICSNK